MRLSTSEAAHLLNNSHVVAIPTETVYGLAASLRHLTAIENVFTLKGRPANNPLIIHLSHADQLSVYVHELPAGFELLAKAFWPGPMTLVLPIDENTIPEKVCAGLSTAAFRIPQHPVAREVIELTGPLVMPSANLSGRPSATSAGHVEEDFGIDFPVVDGGLCARGLESTILIYKDGRWCIIRQGALPAEAFQPVLGYLPTVEGVNSKAPLCPGQLYRHYAPKARLHLIKDLSLVDGVVLGYVEHGHRYPSRASLVVLGSLAAPEQVAESLYKALRQLDTDGVSEAWVDIDVPEDGLWKTILERLTKAAQ